MVDKSGWIALSYSLGYFLLVSVAVFALVLAWKWRVRILKNQEAFITARGQVRRGRSSPDQAASRAPRRQGRSGGRDAATGCSSADAFAAATVWRHTAVPLPSIRRLPSGASHGASSLAPWAPGW